MKQSGQEIVGGVILPSGWVLAPIKDLCALVNGRAFKPSEWSTEGIPIIRIQNLNNPEAEFNCCSFEIPRKYIVNNGQLLFAWSGTPGTSFGAHIWRGGKGALNQHIFKVEIPELLLSKYYLKHVLNHKVTEYIKKAHGTAGLAHITKADFEESVVPLPPWNEQHRIAAKIDELLSDLDSVTQALERVQTQLKRYRQSVLKHAVEGKLTAEWREKHKGETEPASEMLKRILAERRAKWEEQELAKMKANGKVPKDKSWKKKYKEPVQPITERLPKLPEGWCWASLDQLACHEPNSMTDGPFGSNLKTSHYTESGPRVVRLQNIASGQFFDERAHISIEHFGSLSKHRVFPGDIVLATLGKPVPRACLIPEWLGKAIVKADCIRLKVQHDLASNKYVMLVLNSLPIQSCAERIVHGVGRPRLNLVDVRSLPIPLPPRVEQEAIVLDAEDKLSLTVEIQKAIEKNLLRSGRLRDAILRTAFWGRLVSQNPKDEPAHVLLERIRAEREKEAIEKRKIRPSPKSARRTRDKRRHEKQKGHGGLFGKGDS